MIHKLGNQKGAVLLMASCTLFSSLAQILMKLGINKVDYSYLISFINFPLFFGFVSYGLGAGLMLLAFERGELSILYPVLALSYVWVGILSPLVFPGDVMNFWKWLGVFVILFSVGCLGLGGKTSG